jgi:cardiolipin synthase
LTQAGYSFFLASAVLDRPATEPTATAKAEARTNNFFIEEPPYRIRKIGRNLTEDLGLSRYFGLTLDRNFFNWLNASMQIFNLPNSLTLLRILLVPVFTYFFLKGEYRIALIVFVITGMTDVVDGYLARLLRKKTTLGSILDPAADKLLMLVTFIVLAMRALVPPWLSLLVILRDLVIVIGTWILKRLKKKLYFKPTRLSKLNTFFQLFTIFLAFLLTFIRAERPHFLLPHETRVAQTLAYVIYICAGMTVASGIQYTRIGIHILRRGREYADLPLKKDQAGRQ